ncbi:uncharacterized protein LOC142813847 isoform X2 [Rhipicephalus microplus]|uniref:uncharacterized protein LOC142813847 isoform X2 n=1 Tax=Rhipicephalus microplus TaxID=6941 RepID=UPI003F6BF7AF
MVRLRAATFFACLRRTTELSSKKDWSLSAPHEVGLKWADDEGYASQGWAQHSSSRYLRPSEYVICSARKPVSCSWHKLQYTTCFTHLPCLKAELFLGNFAEHK